MSSTLTHLTIANWFWAKHGQALQRFWEGTTLMHQMRGVLGPLSMAKFVHGSRTWQWPNRPGSYQQFYLHAALSMSGLDWKRLDQTTSKNLVPPRISTNIGHFFPIFPIRKVTIKKSMTMFCKTPRRWMVWFCELFGLLFPSSQANQTRDSEENDGKGGSGWQLWNCTGPCKLVGS